MKALRWLLAVCLPLLLMASLQAETALPEDYWQQLLQQTRDASVERRLQEEARLQLSRTEADVQAKALAEAREALRQAQRLRQQLETEQETLETSLQDVQERLQRRSAALGEVFAVYRDEKSTLYGLLSDARYTHQYPELLAFLRPDQQVARLPEIADFYQLWESLQQSWLATAQVSRYQGHWVDGAGQVRKEAILRLGDLQLQVKEGVLRLPEGALPSLWPRQPSGLVRQNAAFLASGQGSVVLDPARGLTLELHSRQPTLVERVRQGGAVGYLILALGLAGLLVAAVQSVRLLLEQKRVRKQLGDTKDLQPDNALGRVLSGMQPAPVSDLPPEALEARLDELLVRESAALERGLSLVKLLAAMAPLLGLLGTVTGMIATFQAITLFGTGDPSLMAAGISQALVTTVLGLITAVPLLLAHLLLQGRSRQLARILEAESSAWLAELLGQSKTAAGASGSAGGSR
ncbi:MotA/TolQ/ExbB proton channel family protein [Marinospirillum alkaliphilum]|uniref:Biopolymer transport protein ExbB n=1 Tax=Marinospirillum alkaliphilum DSM 21637 TaxID=1122209 RepID=A0A1K1UZ61_9GAMM|nr:MotA/TolQ/ExbB proton channel family protein [Marinospirillum alkaliphilum]SFX17836.1 biopolymer transport protein ExbB [Marinospirillum alkaliphilum DSM 21637]